MSRLALVLMSTSLLACHERESGVSVSRVSSSDSTEVTVEWPEQREGSEPELADHVVVAGGTPIHAGPDLVEVARLADHRPLGLRILDQRNGWIIATPSHESCTTQNDLFRHVELELAVRESALIPVALEHVSASFDDGSHVTIARGAPLRALGGQRFELALESFTVTLPLQKARTGARHRPGNVYSNHKPLPGVIWVWDGPQRLRLGDAQLSPTSPAARLHVEITSETDRLGRSAGSCVDLVAFIEGDGDLPPFAPRSLPSHSVGKTDRLEAGTRLYWPKGDLAGRMRATLELQPLKRRPWPGSGPCYEFSPLVLCTAPS